MFIPLLGGSTPHTHGHSCFLLWAKWATFLTIHFLLCSLLIKYTHTEQDFWSLSQSRIYFLSLSFFLFLSLQCTHLFLYIISPFLYFSHTSSLSLSLFQSNVHNVSLFLCSFLVHPKTYFLFPSHYYYFLPLSLSVLSCTRIFSPFLPHPPSSRQTQTQTRWLSKHCLKDNNIQN